MRYYKNVNNEIFAFEDDAQQSIIEEKVRQFNLIPITEGEAMQILNPPPTLEELRERKLQEIAYERWKEETGGYVYHGHEFHSDRESQDRVFQAYMASLGNPNFTATWKTKTGWLEMTASDFITLYNEFQAFLQGLYQKEKALQEQVQAAATIEEVEAVEW